MKADDGLLGDLVRIEADGHLALRDRLICWKDTFLLAEHGVKAGGAGDAAKTLHMIGNGLAGFRGHALRVERGHQHWRWSLVEEIVCETFSLSPYRAVAVPGSYLQGV